MSGAVAASISVVFVGLALWHVYMALMPAGGQTGAVPSVGGKPVFVPSAGATLGVAIALALCAALVAATGGLLTTALPGTLLRGLSGALALGLLARAIGEFRYVGFFKRVKASRFARLDTLLYSPVCLLLAAGVAAVALQAA